MKQLIEQHRIRYPPFEAARWLPESLPIAEQDYEIGKFASIEEAKTKLRSVRRPSDWATIRVGLWSEGTSTATKNSLRNQPVAIWKRGLCPTGEAPTSGMVPHPQPHTSHPAPVHQRRRHCVVGEFVLPVHLACSGGAQRSRLWPRNRTMGLA